MASVKNLAAGANLRKVAIVGVEGSGKTVMLAGLGDLYETPDAGGWLLKANDEDTFNYVKSIVAVLRTAQWPLATATYATQALSWTLRCSGLSGNKIEDVCDVSCLDFPGEAYRVAFGGQRTQNMTVAGAARKLMEHVSEADDLIVLVHLSDILRRLNNTGDPVAQWVTHGFLDQVSKKGRNPRVLLVLSQADRYAATIENNGGARETLAKYLGSVVSNHPQLDVLAVSSIDKTELDDSGAQYPAKDFTFKNLSQIIYWIVAGAQGCGGAARWKALWELAEVASSVDIPRRMGVSQDAVKALVKLLMSGLVPVPDTTLLVSKTLVTQGFWKLFMSKNPSHFKDYDDRPVESVSLAECKAFINLLNACAEKIAAKVRFRLPSSPEEWKRVARGEAGEAFAWIWENAACETHDVAQKKRNHLGLYDVYGNVAEWCEDGSCLGGGFLSAAKDCDTPDAYNVADARSPAIGLRLWGYRIS